MKTQFFNFGGGLLTGALVVVLFSSTMKRNVPDARAAIIDRPGDIEYVEVPLSEFFKDVARYNFKHAKKVEPTMGHTENKPSRMFLYSVDVLEDFIVLVKKLGRQAGIKSEDLGIRFYYGVYPRGQRIKGQDYSSLHTIFMVPNRWSEKEQKFIDIDIRQLSIAARSNARAYKQDKEAFIEQYYLQKIYNADTTASSFMLDASAIEYSGKEPIYNKAAFFPSSLRVERVVINQGQLCPPNCPTLSLLDEIDAIHSTDIGW